MSTKKKTLTLYIIVVANGEAIALPPRDPEQLLGLRKWRNLEERGKRAFTF
jgi:hypothetical protein